MKVKTVEEAKARYGLIENNLWQDEAKWMVMFTVKPEYFQTWINSATKRPVTRIYMNKDMVDAFTMALLNLKKRNLLTELKTFDGCFSIRDVRGEPGKPSCHSYGLAIDLNASENGLNQTPKLTPEFVKCFTDAGFSWGGKFKRKDGMHFSYAWE